ncbi:MAG: 50S ribosomal protein L11 methyltransferase [Desulfurivibrionaceae bacterium]
MLRPPYSRYEKLYVYHLDAADLPPLNDPDLIGNWVEDGNPILFFHRPKEKLIEELCREHGCRLIYQAELDYADWEAGRRIEPFTVAGITVAPIWEPGEAEIVLDPSVIFGTGFHPSTRLCLETMIEYCRKPEYAPRTMLDLGAGTGLLSITAAHLGLDRITAIDNNPLACEVAEKNVTLNGYQEMIEVRCGDLRSDPPDTRVDLVVANLYHTLLVGLFDTPSFWRAKLYIVAGFVPPMGEELLAALPGRIRMIERKRSERWCLWVLQPPESVTA